MSLFREVLPDLQVEVLRLVGPTLTAHGFYLGGGTAVALHLGHRRSIDLDWFREDGLGDPLGLAGQLANDGVALEIGSVGPGTLHGSVAGVRVSLLGYRYPPLEPLVRWPEMGCALASLRDLVCMKLAAAAQRGSRKDLVDVAALLDVMQLEEMLTAYRERYGVRDATHVLYGLTYFDDAEREPPPQMLASLTWADVKRRLSAAVADAAKSMR